MVIYVKDASGDCVEVDLFRDEEVTLDYNIFPMSQIGDTGVSYTNSFEIPMSDKNKALFEPGLVDGETAIHECLMLSDTYCESEQSPGDYSIDYNNDFFKFKANGGDYLYLTGTMYIDSKTINVVGESYSVVVVDDMKARIDKLDEPISNLYTSISDQSFLYRTFGDSVYMPVDKNTTDFFFTGANFNGTAYDELDNGSPLFPVKIGEDPVVVQMYWTYSYYNFLVKALTHYEIDYNFLPQTKVTTDSILSETYVGIPCPLTAYADRDMIAGVTWSDTSIHNRGFISIKDYGDQLDLTYDGTVSKSIVGTVDTLYTVDYVADFLHTGITFHQYYKVLNPDGSCALEIPVNDVSGKLFCNLTIYAKSGEDYRDEPVASVDLGEIDTSEPMFDQYQVFDKFGSFQFLMKAGVEYIAFMGYRYENYSWSDGYYEYNGVFCEFYDRGTVVFNGVNPEEADSAMSKPMTKYYFPSNFITLTFNTEKCYTPLLRDGWNENVSPMLSLENIELTSKAVIQDIITRYNVGVWFDSDSRFNIGRFEDRYNKDLVDLRGLASENKIVYNYSTDLIRTFQYKNKKTNAVKYALEVDEFDDDTVTYSYGDVLEQVVNESGSIEKKLSLKSSNYYKDIYGERVTNPYEFLSIINDTVFWGLGSNEQLTWNDLTICHGYIEDSARTLDIRPGFIADLYDYMDDPQPEDQYSWRRFYYPYSNYHVSEYSHYDVMPMYFLSSTSPTDSLFFGEEDGSFNEDSSLVDNFNVLFDITSGKLKEYIEIEIPLDNCQIGKIIGGAKVKIDNDTEYYPISITGISFNDEHSLVVLRVIR